MRPERACPLAESNTAWASGDAFQGWRRLGVHARFFVQEPALQDLQGFQNLKVMESIRTRITALLIIPILFTSCGGGGGSSDEPIKVKPESTDISGAVQRTLNVVDNEYKISGSIPGKLTIKVKVDKGFAFDGTLSEKKLILKAIPLDKEGMPISGSGKFELVSEDQEKVKNMVQNLQGEAFVKFENFDWKQRKHGDKVKTFKVSSTVKDKVSMSSGSSSGSSSSNSSTSSSTSSSSSSGSGNYDEFLDEYEEYVDKYVKLVDDVQEGNDPQAVSKAQQLQGKAQKLARKLQNARGQLSSSQIQRFQRIQQKLMKKAQELQKEGVSR